LLFGGLIINLGSILRLSVGYRTGEQRLTLRILGSQRPVAASQPASVCVKQFPISNFPFPISSFPFPHTRASDKSPPGLNGVDQIGARDFCLAEDTLWFQSVVQRGPEDELRVGHLLGPLEAGQLSSGEENEPELSYAVGERRIIWAHFSLCLGRCFAAKWRHLAATQWPASK